jgi:hypothetical protein
MYELSLRAGMAAQYQITLFASDGTVVTTYSTADTLAAVVWSGFSTAVLGTPAVSWINPAAGTLQLTLQSADTVNLTPSKYQISVTIDHLGQTVEGWRGWLNVTASPGITVEPTTYCQYEDMVKYMQTADHQQRAETQAGFIDQRGLARAWLDEIILCHSQGQRHIGYVSGYLPYYFLGRDPWIKDQLDLNHLVVSNKIIEINAKKALSLVHKTTLSPTDKGHDEYQKLGYKFECEAVRLVKTLLAEFNTQQIFDSLGQPIIDLVVDCSYSVPRRG